MYKIILVVILLMAIAATAWFVQQAAVVAPVDMRVFEQAPTIRYVSSDNADTITVAYVGDMALVEGMGVENVVLNQVVAASGAKYQNTDGSIVLWNKGDEVALYRNEEVIFSGSDKSASVTYVGGGSSIEVVYDGEMVIVTGSGLESVTFTKVESTSEARYQNQDGSIVFENTGDRGTITRDGLVLFSGLDSAATGSDSNPVMTQLAATTWTWYQTMLVNGERINPIKSQAFSIVFAMDGSVRGTTDCNNYSGTYTLTSNMLVIKPLGMTKMACVDSQEQAYVSMITGTTSVFFTDEGGMTLLIPMDGGVVMFKPMTEAGSDVDPKRLTSETWVLSKAELADDTVLAPVDVDAFTMTFTIDGKVAITTDCNGMGGGYTVNGTTLQIGPNLAATMMACEGSQESEFAALITQALTITESAADTLVLELPQDGGTLTFTDKE